MDTNIITETLTQSLAGTITFPEVIMKLSANGIERYILDLAAFQKLSYSREGFYHRAPFSITDAPPIPQNFDAEHIKKTIMDIQHRKINYQTFLRHIMQAGCSHYEVYIEGKKVIYLGRHGNQHVELFPS